MPSYCSAYGCKNNCYMEFSYHSFSLNNKVILKEWLVQIKNNFVPTKHSKLYSVHFQDGCFIFENFTGKKTFETWCYAYEIQFFQNKKSERENFQLR